MVSAANSYNQARIIDWQILPTRSCLRPEGHKIMPTKNISLTKHFDLFVDETVRKGAYQNASELVRDALRLLEAKWREDELKLQNLRKAASAGFADVARDAFTTIASGQACKAIAAIGRKAVTTAKTRRG